MASGLEGRLVQVGDEAPEFRLPAAQGGEVALSDYRGKRNVVLLFVHGAT